MTMWRTHLWYSLVALVFGLAFSILLWAGTAVPAKRSAPSTPPVPAPAPTEDERTLTLFKAKVEQFQRFLAQEPQILSKQDFPRSLTGQIYYHIRVKLLESGFDVRRSDSLVSPFTGYLYLTYEEEDTSECGDMVIDHGLAGRRVYGYTTYEKAMARIHDCFQRSRISPVENVRLTFAYQDGRWVFKDAIRTKYNNKALLLLAAFGRPEPNHYRVADNQAWEALVK